jgi:hypothetical protein
MNGDVAAWYRAAVGGRARRRFMAGTWTMALVAAVFAMATPARAATPALVATGFLAVTTGSGSSQISRFHLDGSGKKQLTNGPANHYGPSLSPDGKLVLFTGEDGGVSEIYRMNVDGTGVIPITKSPTSAGGASWSPNGGSISYAGTAPGSNQYQVFKAAPDGSGAVQLTHSTGGNNGAPAWSPDGKMIAYVNSGVDTTGNSFSKIWLINGADGSGAKALSGGTGDNYPAWINNGSILFARSDNAGKTSVVLGINLAGVETAQSPTDVFITEPKPLPGGKSYGATMLTGTHLGLVTVSRSNGAALAAAPGTFVLAASTTDGGFVLNPIAVNDGDVFTIAWILAAPSAAANAPAAAAPSVPWLPILFGVVVLALVGGVATYLLRKPKDPCVKEKAAVDRWTARLQRDLAAMAANPPADQATILTDAIALDRASLAAAERELARCQGTAAPAAPPAGGSTYPLTKEKPVEPVKPPPPVTPPPVAPPPVAPPTPPPLVTPPPVIPPPTKEKPKPPPRRDPCPDGSQPKTDVACTCEIELFLLSKAKIEIDGAYQAGEEDIDKAIEGLENALTVASIGTGLIGAVTDPVGSILGTLGVPSVDDATGKATDAAMDALKQLGEQLKKLRKYGWMTVTCPRQRFRFSCVVTSECQDGYWVVTDRSLTMEKLGRATPVTMSNAPHVAGPAELHHAAQQIVNWAAGYNGAAERKMKECEQACK